MCRGTPTVRMHLNIANTFVWCLSKLFSLNKFEHVTSVKAYLHINIGQQIQLKTRIDGHLNAVHTIKGEWNDRNVPEGLFKNK